MGIAMMRPGSAIEPPTHVRTVLGGAELPFVSGGVSTASALIAAACNMIIDCADALDLGAHEDALYDLAHAMNCVVGAPAWE